MAKTNLKDIASAMGVDEKPKSRINVDSSDLASVSDMKIGDTVELAVTGKVVSVSKNYDDKGTNASIEIDKIETDADEDANDTDGE